MRLRFDAYILDAEARQLLRDGNEVHLTPKALELLALLVERRPDAVSKPEIHDRLWPDTFVTEVNLPVLVHELREALDDETHRPRYLRTVPRFGYAFCGSAREEAEAPPWFAACPWEYRLYWGPREAALQPGENVLGRTHDAAIWIDHSSVSRRHALIRVTEDGATLEDCGSKNGTFRGAEPVHGPVPLADGDRILLGSALVVFRLFRRDKTSTATGRRRTGPLPPNEGSGSERTHV
jgi:DNA-binding winged helix-turn-helix (wHTH) protein